jgi:hydroxyacylglutathione hydrolase
MRAIWLTPLLIAAVLQAQAPQPNGAGLEPGVLPDRWPTANPRCMEMQEYYVHEYNPNFFMLRQTPCTDYEKPFIFVIFGSDKALLWDTGSRNALTREAADRLIARWLKVNNRAGIPLIVIHSHHHSDHVAGDPQFMDRPDTTFVKPDLASLKAFFGFQNWPEEIKTFDLGGRPMDIVPIPGHTDDSIALYDRRTGILLTGDTVYPGRLYVTDFADFKKSIHRLAEFTDGKLIAHVLGNHIEQTRTPYLEYPIGKLAQPDEHQLQMSAGDILELDRALSHMQGPSRLALRDMTIWPLNDEVLKEMRAKQHESEEADRRIVYP